MYSRRWLIAAIAVLGLAGGCSQFNTNLTSQTSSSVLAYLSPQTANAGDSGFTVTANGAGFVPGAILLWNVGSNQVPLTTTFVSSTQVTAIVPASDLASAGTIKVAVQIPGSAVSPASNIYATTTTEISNVVNFQIGAMPGAAPAITSLSASTSSLAATPYCSPNGFTLTVAGSNFNSASVVNWNGSPRTTTFDPNNSGRLTASILAQDVAFPGTAAISVSNAAGPSNMVSFTITTPATALPGPNIATLSPTTVKAGSPTFTLTVTGGSFVPCSVVQWDGSAIATAYVSAAQLNATIPAADVFTAGAGSTPRTAKVTVFTLGPGGGTSGPIMFTINP